MRIKVHLRSYATKKDKRRWLLIVREPGRVERYIQLGAVSRREAEERRIATLNELCNGKYREVSASRPFLSEFCDRFLGEYLVGIRAARTVELYRYGLQHLRRAFQGCRLDQISREDIEQMLADLNVANRTKNITLHSLRMMFRKAVEWKYLAVSPVTGIPNFKEEKGGSRPMTSQEVGRVLDTATPWGKSVIKVMVYSGMRPGELSQLKFSDVDWENNTLRVVSDAVRKTKNRRSRIIPLSPQLKEELHHLRSVWPNMSYAHDQPNVPPYYARAKEQQEYVFCHLDGRPIKSFRRSLKAAFRKARIDGVTPHGLRKTFCSLLARGGVNPKVAQRLMGHADIRMTMDIYTEVEDDQLRSAVALLPTSKELQRHKFHVVQSVVE